MNDRQVGLQSFRQKRRRASGEVGQEIVRLEMRRRRFKMVEAVHTPWRVVRKMGRIVGAFPVEKVSGDFIAVGENGRKVLVEVKSRETGNLPWSAFEDHQVAALSENVSVGGLSIVAWVQGTTVKFYHWPIQDFGPGKSMKW